MRRRAFLTMVPAITVGLAGCNSDGGSGDTPTDSSDGPQTPVFEADITFPSCTSVRVEADSYHTVLALVSDNSNVIFDEAYSGTETFETELPIEEVVVYSDESKDSALNPDLESCVDDG